MPDRSTDTSSRFRQIVDHLRGQILETASSAHSALPSERSVAEQHGVSRMTARRALEAIEAEGLAYSEGRRGRFVSPKRVKYDISSMVSLAAGEKENDAKLEIELVSKATALADQRIATALSVPVKEALYQYTRLFRTDGYAAFVETEYVIARNFPGLLDHDLQQSSTRLLEQHYGTAAHTGDIVIRMRALTADEAGLLGLAPYHPGIELEQVIRDTAGTPFCFGRQVWRGELAEFSAQAIVNRQA